jgi:DNA-directed RNA polymerase specialized sigma24 family protein
MSAEAEFDAFYRDARERLLVQTFALTGDVRVARSAVRDAFVVAWHHWRKVARHDRPEDWVRPHAWQHAHRRHVARPWHREKGLDPEVAATIEALGKLSHTQRRVLLLTHLASVRLEEMAHEVGLTVEDTTRELQSATSQLAVHRGSPTTAVPLLLRSLLESPPEVRWPRASIIRRSGATRRRTHTTAGAVAAVLAVAVTGTLVSDPSGVRPTLDRAAVGVVSAPRPSTTPAPEDAQVLPTSAMLPVDRVVDLLPGNGWAEVRTHDNTYGDGLVMPCQQARYADPRLIDALVREIRTPRGREPRRSVVATTEVSRSEAAARRALARLAEWFARCDVEGRTQLLGTSTVKGVDDAVQVVLRDWDDPVTTTVVGMARSGRFVVTTASSVRRADVELPRLQAQLLASAVAGVCELDGGGRCPDDDRAPQLEPRDPLPAGEPTTMLVENDLPPVSRVDSPWVGTRPGRLQGDNAAATRCDRTSFAGRVGGKPLRDVTTRTFLIPEAKLPVEFGLTETVGRLPAPQARAFVSTIRRKMSSCADRDLGTEVFTAASRASTAEELAVWHVTVEVSDTRSVKYYMAVARTGGQVLQLGFIPAPGVEMDRGAFLALAERGLQRLRSGA